MYMCIGRGDLSVCPHWGLYRGPGAACFEIHIYIYIYILCVQIIVYVCMCMYVYIYIYIYVYLEGCPPGVPTEPNTKGTSP